jgi:hypothetical protein
MIRVPGGKPVGRFIACVGFATTSFTIALSVLPAPDETNKLLAVIKIVGLSGVLLGTGWLLYFCGKRKRNVSASSV